MKLKNRQPHYYIYPFYKFTDRHLWFLYSGYIVNITSWRLAETAAMSEILMELIP